MERLLYYNKKTTTCRLLRSSDDINQWKFLKNNHVYIVFIASRQASFIYIPIKTVVSTIITENSMEKDSEKRVREG